MTKSISTIFASALLITGISSFAQADVLKCWDAYSSTRTPLITGKIVSNSELTELTVREREDGLAGNLRGSNETVTGTEITTKRSPYVGNQEFLAQEYRLVLPMDLSNDNLILVQQTGIGMGKGENGVAIGTLLGGGDGAGSHFSVRLRCRSYAR